jgi:hypothetical protein
VNGGALTNISAPPVSSGTASRKRQIRCEAAARAVRASLVGGWAMSLEMQTYAAAFDDSLISPWIARMNTLGMRCEIHPEFSFQNHTGFLPFKVILESSKHEPLVGTPLLTGFELYLSGFDLHAAIAAASPEPKLIDKLLGTELPKAHLVNPDVDARLAPCKQVLTFIWSSADSLELRMATISSTVLAELTGGICSYPADGIWYPNSGAVEDAVREAEAYESSLPPSELKLHKFESWL